MTQTSFIKRIFYSSPLFAVMVLIIVVTWVISGQYRSDEKTNAKVERKALLPTVMVRDMEAEMHTKTIEIYGVSDAFRSAHIKAETNGKVEEIVAKEGSFLQKDDLILKIEMRDRAARVKEAEAFVEQKTIDYEASKKLAKQGYKAENDLAEAKAELESARAGLILAQIDYDNTYVRAPFAGYLEKIYVEEGDFVSTSLVDGGGKAGNALAMIEDKTPFIVWGEVVEADRAKLKVGGKASVQLIDGKKYEGKIHYISSVADENVRSYTIEIAVENADASNVLSGSTATIYIPVESYMAFHIPKSSLALGDDGQLGIKQLINQSPQGVDIKGEVYFQPVKIFDYDNKGVWTRMKEDQFTLITTGQAFIEDGAKVKAKYE